MFEKVEFTNMCMMCDGNRVVVINRKKEDWPGITFPGGHVETGESFVDAVIREAREETGLTIYSPQLCGTKDWYEDQCRYVVLFYKANLALNTRWTFGKAEKKDFNQINELFVEMLQTIYQTDRVTGYSDGALDRFFDGRDEWISIAMDQERIIAFLSIEVHHEANEYIYLDDFSVTKQYRGKGIGSSMIRIAESYAKEIHIPAVCLHVEKSNAAALRLYERLGYIVQEDQGSRYFMMKKIPI